MKRRQFFRFIGGAAVAGPSVAKQASDAALARSGVAFGIDGASGSLGEPASICGSVPGGSSFAKLAKIIAKTGIPKWKEEEIREQTRRVYFLDPDLAAVASMSASAKISAQRERNYRRAIDFESLGGSLLRRDEQQAWLKKHNLDWW